MWSIYQTLTAFLDNMKIFCPEDIIDCPFWRCILQCGCPNECPNAFTGPSQHWKQIDATDFMSLFFVAGTKKNWWKHLKLQKKNGLGV